MHNEAINEADVVLIGAGIMSSTVGVLLKELEPSLSIVMFETLADCALESSEAWNNAGTGHAANCEMNYTPQRADGSVDISRALQVNVEFDLSRQFWTYLVQKGAIKDPRSFIHPVPHMSFVHDAANVAFLRKRFEAMSAHHCYEGMEYSEDRAKIAEWAPLIMEGRSADEPVAATRIITGTDVDYGALTHHLVAHLVGQPDCSVHYNSRVTNLVREGSRWRVEVEDLKDGTSRWITAKFVFIGAGGGSLPLLQKSDIPEGRGYAGFPVSGIWLRCDAPEIAERHHAKVYGKAAVGSPPMSVPHLDARVIGGRHSLLFGPYAGFSSKFLKHGSLLDLVESIRPANVKPLLSVARDNFDLTEYLIEQVLQSESHRLATLDEYYPRADPKDWKLQVAGQRVQIIKPDVRRGGLLEFGTELVGAADHSLVALLGASPGASTAAFIALEVLQKCFAGELVDSAWLPKLKEIIPSYGINLIEDADLCRSIRASTSKVLQVDNIAQPQSGSASKRPTSA
ncbi:malate dehydrogenase (quinone) [Bradyrhizobium sp. STM 3557]|uniref:malate dehydrogenase (quinone) n=1 Tax=Bradyrhizobium sp. STM 3557 TaxID=578920 RepID=UPI00388E4D9D